MSFGLGFRLYLNFPGRVVLILGVCLAILGILDIVLAVTGFVQKVWGHYYATGIWCGVVVFINGLCGILASQTRTKFAVKTFFVVSLISVLVSFIMIILSCGGLDFRSNFYDHVFSYHGKLGRATKAVHGSLLALASVEFVVSIINAILCLKSSCQEEKASIKYDQPKLKQSSVHRPPSYNNSDRIQGFRGGNPNCVPVNEQPKSRRYQSPRRSHNGMHKEETLIDEPTETTEFLPNALEEEFYERNKKRERQRSKEHDNSKDTHDNKPPTRGRMYRRQLGQTNSEAKASNRNHDCQRKGPTLSDKSILRDQQPYYTQNKSELDRWKHTDELVQRHQYYHMSHSKSNQPDMAPKKERTEYPTAAPHPLTDCHASSEIDTTDPAPRVANRNSVERNTVPKASINYRTSLDRSNSIQEQQTTFMPALRQGTQDKLGKDQQKPIRCGQEQRSPTRPSKEQSLLTSPTREQITPNTPGGEKSSPKRHGNEQTMPSRPGLEQSMSTRHGQEQMSSTRTGQDQKMSHRALPMINTQPSRREQSDKSDRKGLYRERRNSVERSNSFKSNVNVANKDSNKRSHNVVDNRQEQFLDGNQSNSKHSRVTRSDASVEHKSPIEKGTEQICDILRYPEIKQEPLRRSIGARGSYSAAVNLMPTEPMQQTVTEHRIVKDPHNKPPTAFGEEELPAYAEIFPSESHIYSSIESAISRQETDRIISSDQCAYSADHSVVSQSVADEEVQEILGTRMTNTSTAVKVNFVNEIPNRDKKNVAINSKTVQHGTTGMHSATSSTPQYKLPREETVNSRFKQKLQLRPLESNPDQSSSDASLALPSPLTPSPIFVRGHKTKSRDLEPNSDLQGIPVIKTQLALRASFPLRKSELDTLPRRWGISPIFENTGTQPQVPVSLLENEGNALNELSTSFPLLGALGGVDFGISDQESYLKTPDSSVYTFNFDEVKPKVFTVSPFRFPRNSSPLGAVSVAQMPSTDDEIENRPRVIETVNVGLAIPPVQKQKQNRKILPTRPVAVGQATTSQVVKPKRNIASSFEHSTGHHRPAYFYPPERLPSRVADDEQKPTKPKQSVLNHEKESKSVSGQTYSPPSRVIYSGISPVHVQTKVHPSWGSSRPEDANVAFLAFHDTLSQRTAWERQTFPPVQNQDMGGTIGPRPRTVGRAAMRRVMRSEQSAQEEPLHQQSPTDNRFHFRIPPSNITTEPSPPLSGGPPPYSSVARALPPQRLSDRAPLQPHSSGQSNGQNRSDTTRRQPVFSLVL